MAECVIYARVSTKEQQNEGYSIPAQLKAIRAFCEAERLVPVAEFVEADSAGKAGRKQFSAMLDYLSDNPQIGVVVAHKLDRLYRNFRDQITLEDRGIRARYVIGDIPDTPQGELLRDVNLSVSKFYLGNLSEEVKKGMDEKVSQGGWPHRAPTGYLNDKNTRTLVIDPERAPLVKYAFERYATGQVSLSMLAKELHARGFTSRSGAAPSVATLHKILKSPMYTGVVRHKGVLYPGAHEAIVSQELFDQVQTCFEPHRNGIVKDTRHVFALRDWLFCKECGCKITAERQRGHVYYRCTHGKGKDVCAQRAYTREEVLSAQIDAILGGIEIDNEIIEALVRDSELLDKESGSSREEDKARLRREIAALDSRASRLLDGYLDGLIPADEYKEKKREIQNAKVTFEQQVSTFDSGRIDRTSQVRALAQTAAGARIAFQSGDVDTKREILAAVLSNASVEEGNIVSYQLKRPFECLEKDSKGAFRMRWWAIQDLNL